MGAKLAVPASFVGNMSMCGACIASLEGIEGTILFDTTVSLPLPWSPTWMRPFLMQFMKRITAATNNTRKTRVNTIAAMMTPLGAVSSSTAALARLLLASDSMCGAVVANVLFSITTAAPS